MSGTKLPDASSIILRATLGFDDEQTTNSPTPKAQRAKENTMQNSVYTDPINHVTKRGVPGIHSNSNVKSLVDTLARLELCSSEMAVPLGQIAAAGNKPV